jgi:hypothetical protein
MAGVPILPTGTAIHGGCSAATWTIRVTSRDGLEGVGVSRDLWDAIMHAVRHWREKGGRV